MAASVLGKAVGTGAEVYTTGPAQKCAQELPRRSTRELEAVFARRDGRWRMAGLGLALTVSGAFWVALAAVAF